MPLIPEQVLEQLVVILPDFAGQWRSDTNCFRADDGSFTLWGVFAGCSYFVRDHYEQMTLVQRRELGQFISQCLSSPGTDLGNAAATCFLENLTFERFSKLPQRHRTRVLPAVPRA